MRNLLYNFLFFLFQTRALSNKRSQEAEESKNEYAAQLQSTNQFQRDFYNTNMPQVFQVCQNSFFKVFKEFMAYLSVTKP